MPKVVELPSTTGGVEQIGSAFVYVGDCLESLRELPEESVHCCVTSPPYWGLRDYGHEKQLGREDSPEEYLFKMVEVFREVHRVLREDGTLWLNLGDSYANSGTPSPDDGEYQGLKPKDLIGIPWRMAFALRADGWYLRQDIIWHKPKINPESVKDRCSKAHEYIFLLSKSSKYYYDGESVKEPFADKRMGNPRGGGQYSTASGRGDRGALSTGLWNTDGTATGRNRRTVWTIAPTPYKGAHFATFPPALIEPCIKAGCPVGGVVLDPFGGSGTTGRVASDLGRKSILCELNPEYIELIRKRMTEPAKPASKKTNRNSNLALEDE